MAAMLDMPQRIRRHIEAVEELMQRHFGAGTFREEGGILPAVEATASDPSGGFIAEGVRYQFSTGGKRLRPALCLLACEALGGDPRAAFPFALATEVLHNYLLIHDDIEDGDTMRRDQQTLWARFGVPNALNIADHLIARAYRLIAEAPLPPAVNLKLLRIFSEVFQRTVEGQALDINLRGSAGVTLETYDRIVQLKTAYYLALTWVGGAIVAGASDDALEPLWRLGRFLGPAFQIRDDIIDLTEGKGRGGEIGCDLREGKPSIFFAYILERRRGTEEERRRLMEIVRASREATLPADVRWAIDFYRREGAIDFAQAEAARLAGEARELLEGLPFGGGGRELFQEMIRFIIDRRF
jgi:geranylgeranyl pyrophosphate synthase